MDLDARMMDKFPLDTGKGLLKESKVLISTFVILHHTGHISQDRGDHWDWLIQFPEYFLAKLPPRMQASPAEQTQGLLTFASEIQPKYWSPGTMFWRLAPHRSDYLEYEGPISKGRGQVQRVASGQLHWIFLDDFHLSFRLLRLGWIEDPQGPVVFGGASTKSSPGQYSLDHSRGACCPSNAPETLHPWTSRESDPGAYWRLS